MEKSALVQWEKPDKQNRKTEMCIWLLNVLKDGDGK